MYEVDYCGWTRTPEELTRLKTDSKYRRRLNWQRLYKGFVYNKIFETDYKQNGLFKCFYYSWKTFWQLFGNWALNKNNF